MVFICSNLTKEIRSALRSLPIVIRNYVLLPNHNYAMTLGKDFTHKPG